MYEIQGIKHLAIEVYLTIPARIAFSITHGARILKAIGSWWVWLARLANSNSSPVVSQYNFIREIMQVSLSSVGEQLRLPLC